MRSGYVLSLEKGVSALVCHVNLRLTLCKGADGLAEVTGLTVDTSGVSKHAHHKTKFTKETMLSVTIRKNMRFRKSPDWNAVM